MASLCLVQVIEPGVLIVRLDTDTDTILCIFQRWNGICEALINSVCGSVWECLALNKSQFFSLVKPL